ncbi:hypothetical protein GCM10010166_62130 [Couchioplanes caeruleus subsp. azureus]|nr:hypothetical protein GCM10010166_62130 [Couchioplanes caeruleus subsp. azureus]
MGGIREPETDQVRIRSDEARVGTHARGRHAVVTTLDEAVPAQDLVNAFVTSLLATLARVDRAAMLARHGGRPRVGRKAVREHLGLRPEIFSP